MQLEIISQSEQVMFREVYKYILFYMCGHFSKNYFPPSKVITYEKNFRKETIYEKKFVKN